AASVIGSLSGRMAGRTEAGDGSRISNLNSLGIPREKRVRACFPLADEFMTLCGGDFDAYEVSIAEAVYDDPELRKQLLTCNDCGYVCTVDEYEFDTCSKCGAKDSRRKIHGLFAMELTGLSYDEVLATKGSDDDWYDKGKRGFFSQIYGGDENTLVDRLSVELELARKATTNFRGRYKGVGAAYKRIYDDFCSMRQPGGIGTKVFWNEPKDVVVSLNGFR